MTRPPTARLVHPRKTRPIPAACDRVATAESIPSPEAATSGPDAHTLPPCPFCRQTDALKIHTGWSCDRADGTEYRGDGVSCNRCDALVPLHSWMALPPAAPEISLLWVIDSEKNGTNHTARGPFDSYDKAEIAIREFVGEEYLNAESSLRQDDSTPWTQPQIIVEERRRLLPYPSVKVSVELREVPIGSPV